MMLASLLIITLLISCFGYFFWYSGRQQRSEKYADEAFFDIRRNEIADEAELGQLSVEESQQLAADLMVEQRVSQTKTPFGSVVQSRFAEWCVLLFFILTVVGSISLYQGLGYAKDVQFHQAMMSETLTPSQVSAFLQYRSRRYDRAEDWYYEAVDEVKAGQYSKAVLAFEKALDRLPEDSQDRLNLLVEYAQAIFYANKNQSSEALEKALQRIFAIAPNQPNALGLKGVTEFDQANYLGAVLAWQEAIRYNPNSAERMALLTAIGKARQLGKISYQTLAPIITDQIAVQLTWQARDRQWQPNDVLLVYAQVPGQKMPVAIQRVLPKDLASPILLTNLDALMPTANLAEVEQVDLVVKLANLQDADLTKGQIIGTKRGVVTNRKEIFTIKLAL
ncbi:tetratricopeptide repeat protein [Marinomonas posidonica]|uniref:tetratricopeptide repeat protein n=1 Tax=Marinomonas posidonica TaxID=936476 RepID=UPI0037360DE3